MQPLTKLFISGYITLLPCRLLFGLPLQLVVGHGDDGEDQVDEVERAQEDVEDEEEDVHRAGRHQCDLEKNQV